MPSTVSASAAAFFFAPGARGNERQVFGRFLKNLSVQATASVPLASEQRRPFSQPNCASRPSRVLQDLVARKLPTCTGRGATLATYVRTEATALDAFSGHAVRILPPKPRTTTFSAKGFLAHPAAFLAFVSYGGQIARGEAAARSRRSIAARGGQQPAPHWLGGAPSRSSPELKMLRLHRHDTHFDATILRCCHKSFTGGCVSPRVAQVETNPSWFKDMISERVCQAPH